MIRRAVLAASFLAATSAATMAQAEPGAMVVSAIGEIAPAVADFAEVEVGARFTLAADAEIVLVHFRGCEEIAVAGGDVLIRPSGVVHRGGRMIYREKGDCPGAVDLVDTDAKGAVVLLRSVDGDPNAERPPAPSGATPRFIVGGAGGARATGLAIFSGDEAITRLKLDAGRASWPAGAAPLTEGETYAVVVESAGSGPKGHKITVSAGGPGLIVLRP